MDIKGKIKQALMERAVTEASIGEPGPTIPDKPSTMSQTLTDRDKRSEPEDVDKNKSPDEWGINDEGWNEIDLTDVGLMDLLDRCYNIQYELKSARRGTVGDFGDTVDDLSNEMRQIGKDFIKVADKIDEKIGESPSEE